MCVCVCVWVCVCVCDEYVRSLGEYSKENSSNIAFSQTFFR